MKNLVLLIAASLTLSACMAITDGAVSTQRAFTTTGKSVTSTFETTTDASRGDGENKNWQYDE